MIAALLLAAQAAAPAAVPTMTCRLVVRGNDLGVRVYRLDGIELTVTDPSQRTPLVLSSAVRRVPLGRSVDGGVVTETAASHRVRGSVVTRTVYWATGGALAAPRFTETYDFAAKVIRRDGLPPERCR